MKILYLSNQRIPTEKAYGLQIAKMCEAFIELGHEVILVAPTRRNPIKEDIFDYYNVRRNFKLKMIWAPDFYLPGRLDRLAFEVKVFFSGFVLAIHALFLNVDLIYSRDEWPLWFLSFCRKIIVFETHKFSKFKKFIYRRFKNNKLVVVTQGLWHEFEKVGFKSILVASDGVDLEEFSLDIFQEEARKKVSLPLDKKIVMYTGHLYDWKGVSTLLETARLISNVDKDILFVFVGGTDEDVEKFRETAKGLNNVLILGHKPHYQIPLYLKAADVLVLPNKGGDRVAESYTSPLKLFEYMASGRPIVASALPSLREILNADNSILVSPNNPVALAAGIQETLKDASRTDKITQAALRDVQQYSWQKRAENIVNFLTHEPK